MEAKEPLKQGLRWRVDAGENVMFFKDPWLQVPYGFKVLTKNPFLTHSLRVRDLIDQETRRDAEA